MQTCDEPSNCLSGSRASAHAIINGVTANAAYYFIHSPERDEVHANRQRFL